MADQDSIHPRTAVAFLRADRSKPALQGHPWLYSGAIARFEGDGESPLVEVRLADGRSLGLAFWSPRSQIRARLLHSGTADREFFAARLRTAAVLRRAVLPALTTGYRVLNAEGDGVPGWTVDRFGDVLVSQITVAGLEAVRTEAYAALIAEFPGCAIVQRNALPARRAEGLGQEDERIVGEIPAEVEFEECGLRFAADLVAGQKTGFYCDQRENRRLAEQFGRDRSVLDLFAHTGGFGFYALRGGAREVVHVESSPLLIERGRRFALWNGYDESRSQWVQADVFADLRQRQTRSGLIICDPPPLARRRGDVDAAARAYKDLNRLALRLTEDGGFLLTFTCSGAIDSKLFRQILFAAATEAGVRAQLLQPLGAALDHPVSMAHPEGEYLKGWLIAVSGR
ncbi:MAG: class I SAM-dependent rRNA methyltransferase [Acidobacteriota bacterium]